MAIIRNTAAMRYKGKVGNTTFYTQGGRQLARVSQNSSNYGDTARRSELQQSRRVKWSNLVRFYTICSKYLKGSFQTKLRTQTDYNKFMSKNLVSARIALTKSQAEQGCCVLDTFLISEGDLTPIELTLAETRITTSIKARGDEGEQITTVGALFERIKDINPEIKLGSQLSLFSCGQYFAPGNLPFVDVVAYELTFDDKDGDTIASHFGNIECYIHDGYVTFSPLSPDGYYAMVHSTSASGQLRVSTARLIAGDSEPAENYSSAEQVERAAASYGVDPSVFFDSGSSPIFV